jgi:SnoaL-like domain
VGTDADRLLAAVERSPAAAARHDRDGWVALFSDDGRVEDPVGSRPHVGRPELRRFFDTFIGPRDITFHRDVDIVSGHSVLRDLTLGIRMSASVSLAVPAILHYELRESHHAPQIVSLRAYWELPPMMWQFARTGVAAVPAGLALARGLLSNQGLTGAAGFLRGVVAPRRRQRDRLAAVLTALSVGDDLAFRRHLAAAHLPADFDWVRARLRGAHWRRPLSAGSSAVATVHATDGAVILLADFTAAGRIERLQVFG